MTTTLSLLTGRSTVSLLHAYDAEGLQRQWLEQFGIDIADELRGVTEVSHWLCDESELEFFEPGECSGSSNLYANLAAFHWYHEAARWEFNLSLPWLQKARKLLEVGCGSGTFLDILRGSFVGETYGLELNPITAAQALSKGHSVLPHPIDSEALKSLGPFDVVCSYQVLEHVSDPLAFLESMISVLVPGGHLIVGVPNKDSFIRHFHTNLLDLPPHHMSRWSAKTLEFLSTVLPLEVCAITAEPLAPNHAADFIEAHVQRALSQPLVAKITGKLLGPALAWTTTIRSQLIGHSLLAVYRKTKTGDAFNFDG